MLLLYTNLIFVDSESVFDFILPRTNTSTALNTAQLYHLSNIYHITSWIMVYFNDSIWY